MQIPLTFLCSSRGAVSAVGDGSAMMVTDVYIDVKLNVFYFLQPFAVQ